jgi:hypothetical protein
MQTNWAKFRKQWELTLPPFEWVPIEGSHECEWKGLLLEASASGEWWVYQLSPAGRTVKGSYNPKRLNASPESAKELAQRFAVTFARINEFVKPC